ncbi:equilibrative nucleoside transporter 4-like [Lineus longissimus]|uniref:equilibrative nucleoside transporter 4-like n=1 Tax=Lineus longissimus TaxID=88925 RepID=UPI00315D539C
MASSEVSNPSNSNEAGEKMEPKDNYNLVYCASVLCGVAFLMPWNSITMAVDFFKMTYPGTKIMFAISISYLIVVWIGSTLSNLTVELLNLRVKTIFGFVLSLSGLAYLAIVEAWLRPFSLVVSYRLVLLCCVFVSFGSSIMQTNIYGLFSMLPKRYTQGVMVGESLAATITVTMRVLTKLSVQDAQTSTVIFFTSSLLVSIICLIAFLLAMRSPYVKFYVNKCQVIEGESETAGLLKLYELDQVTNKPNDADYGSTAVDKGQNGDVTGALTSSAMKESLTVRIKRAFDNRMHMVRIIWPYMLAFWLNYFVTLGVFPGLSSEVISCKLGSWMPVIMLSLFNVFDLIGKIFTAWEYDCPSIVLVLCSTARLVLIPLFILSATPRLHPVIGGMALPFFFSALNGITNGYFGCVPIILAPTKVSAEKREIAGNMMVFALTTGLSTGSATAFGYLAILEPLTGLNNPCLQNGTYPM